MTNKLKKEIRKEKEKNRRFEEILDAALKIFSEKGYYKTRMEDIADEAALGKGTLYYYFSTKEELFIELFLREEIKLANAVLNNIKDSKTINELFLKTIRFFTEYFTQNIETLSILFPVQSGFVSIEDKKLRERIEKAKEGFVHIKGIAGMIREIVENSCPEQEDKIVNIVYYFGALIMGIGDFIRMDRMEQINNMVNNLDFVKIIGCGE